MLSELQRLGKDVLLTLIRHLLGLLIGLAISVLLARVLGARGNGIYGMALLLPTLAATFLNLGIGPANVYFLAAEKIDKTLVIKNTMQLWVFLSIAGVCLGYLAVYIFGEKYFTGIDTKFLKLSIWIFPLALLSSFLASILQGIRDFKKFNIVVLITPLSNVIFALVTLLIFDLSITGAIWAYLLGQLVTVMILIGYLPEIGRVNDVFQVHSYARSSLNYGFKNHLSSVLTFINYRADLFLVNFYLGPLFTGVYLVAVQIGERAWTLSHVVSTVLLPHLADLKRDESLRLQLTPFIARSIFGATLIGSIVLALVADFLIDILFGPDFHEAVLVLLWLLPGICCGAAARIYANDISARGKPELNFYAAVVVVIVNIALNVALIPSWGMVGGAWATSTAYFLNMVLKIGLYIYVTKIKWYQVFIINQIDHRLYLHIKKRVGNG